jgi:UDP-N-acetylmuramyl tripeptide synthase
MVENALATCAAALGMGVAEHDVLAGLATFAPDPEHNAGRLNVFEIDGRTVIVDYAHNETGLLALIEFARARFPDRTSITAVIGTAGDRADEVFRGLGRIAARHAARILLKQNPGYLRGRDPDEMLELSPFCQHLKGRQQVFCVRRGKTIAWLRGAPADPCPSAGRKEKCIRKPARPMDRAASPE